MILGKCHFRPSRYTPSLGHDGLEANLETRTERCASYIRHATFPTANPHLMERTFYDTHQQENRRTEAIRVCAGTFHLRAGNDELIRGVSFGGYVRVQKGRQCTICRLDSAAPVFYLAEYVAGTSEFLYSQFLAHLAKRRAALGDDAEYARRLFAADPFTLFVAMLQTLDIYLARFRGSWAMEGHRQARAAVRRARQTLQAAGEWPAYPPELADLL